MERDPNGFTPQDAGAKLDAGKQLPDLVLGEFVRALDEVVKVGTAGAHKYSPSGWVAVPDGINRYLNAAGRHRSAWKKGKIFDVVDGTEVLHKAQEIWNLLAALELEMREYYEDSDRKGKG